FGNPDSSPFAHILEAVKGARHGRDGNLRAAGHISDCRVGHRLLLSAESAPNVTTYAIAIGGALRNVTGYSARLEHLDFRLGRRGACARSAHSGGEFHARHAHFPPGSI